jgi:hypothetical protein
VTLAETQALFHEVLTGGPDASPARLEACFAGTAELPAADRLAIYAGMFLSRQVEALRQELPRLAAFLGEERFGGLCQDYLRQHPSEHHDIGQLGRHLAAFLRRHPDPSRPDLADLAELELARDAVFLEAPAAAVGPEALAALPEGSFLEARLRFVPALRLLAQDHDVAALWRSLERGEEPGPPKAGPAAVAVWRTGFDVFHAALDPAEAAALASALAGEPLSRVCAAFGEGESAAAAAFAALSSWLEEGWVAGVGAVSGPSAARPSIPRSGGGAPPAAPARAPAAAASPGPTPSPSSAARRPGNGGRGRGGAGSAAGSRATALPPRRR